MAKLIVGVDRVAGVRFHVAGGGHGWRAGVYGRVRTNLIRVGRVGVTSFVFARGSRGAGGMFIEDFERAIARTG